MSPQHLILEEYQELKELRHSVGTGGERGGKEKEKAEAFNMRIVI